MSTENMSYTEAQTSVVACYLVPALYFHISLAGLAACSINFHYPPCQQTDSACLPSLVITGFRGQVIRSWLHCHPVRLLRPQGAYSLKEVLQLHSVILYFSWFRLPSLEQNFSCMHGKDFIWVLLRFNRFLSPYHNQD